MHFLQLDNIKYTVLISVFEKYCDHESRVRGHSRSLKLVLFDSLAAFVFKTHRFSRPY